MMACPPTQGGSRAGYGTAQLLARPATQVTREISPCAAQAPHAHTAHLSSRISSLAPMQSERLVTPWVCSNRPVEIADVEVHWYLVRLFSLRV